MIVIANPLPEELPCPLCQLEERLDYLENQQPKSNTAWLRGVFCVLLGFSAVSFTTAWFCFPNSAMCVFIIFGTWAAFMAGHMSGRLEVRNKPTDSPQAKGAG